MNILNEVVKETEGFRLRVKSWKCMRPNDLNSIEFIQEELGDGEVIRSSTYNFFMSNEEVASLCQILNKVQENI
jgi:dissimilatory sulfite reductase (desulfoviridin) alpha/beta subunit